MCGPSRPATGHRIAIMFPSPTTSRSASPSSSLSSSPTSSPEPGLEIGSPRKEAYSLSFQQAEQDSAGTKAVFRAKDTTANNTGNGLFGEWRGIEMRIERHGDLTLTNTGLQPLHQFQLQPMVSTSKSGNDEMEFSLPERLDLNVSEKGIVGRQVTVVARGESGEVLQMGNGIVGFD